MVQRRQQLRHRLMLCVTNIFHSPVIIGCFLCSRSLDVIYILPQIPQVKVWLFLVIRGGLGRITVSSLEFQGTFMRLPWDFCGDDLRRVDVSLRKGIGGPVVWCMSEKANLWFSLEQHGR